MRRLHAGWVAPLVLLSALSAAVTASAQSEHTSAKDPVFGWTFTGVQQTSVADVSVQTWVQSTEDLPKAADVTRLVAVILNGMNRRLGQPFLPAGRRVQIWMTRQGDTGGEQVRDAIYLYRIHDPVAPEELLRVIAHELGHQWLPGIRGFTSPEPYANGAMGEVLFIRWVIEDMSPDERLLGLDVQAINQWYSRRYGALLDGWLSAPIQQEPRLHLSNAVGMRTLAGFCMWIERIHGSSTLAEVLLNLPGHRASDLLAAMKRVLQEFQSIKVMVPPGRSSVVIWLTAGVYRQNAAAQAARTLTVARSGWTNIAALGMREVSLSRVR